MKIKNLIALPAIALAVLFTSCEKEPKASFTASKTEVDIDEVVTFTNTTVDGETYSWNFGDGNTSTLVSPTHKYAAAGTYTVTLKAESKNGKKTDVATATIKVKEAPANNGLTYNNTNYPLTKGYFEYYGPIGDNPNSFNFDILLLDNGIDYNTGAGEGNIVYIEAWSNSSAELAVGTYTMSSNYNPFTYSMGSFGFNINIFNETGEFFDITAGNFAISKSGNQHTINASFTLDNGKNLTVSFKGVFTNIDYSQKKSATKRFKK